MASVSYMRAGKLAELLQKADGGAGLVVKVISASRLALGRDPLHPTIAIDFSKEAIAPYESVEGRTNAGIDVARTNLRADDPRANKATRRSGLHWFELLGNRSEFGSLRDLLRAALLAIESARPGSLEELCHIRPRSKRIVARDKKLLFTSEAMSEEFSEQLGDGWWYGTNNSAQETKAWLQRACSCAGLTWGSDFNTNL
ncbi:MAG TPA: hypothetical protein VMB83_01145 [Roseiarcus sp.]|nr:hypothetical protein [Roseiarcus sp.]